MRRMFLVMLVLSHTGLGFAGSYHVGQDGAGLYLQTDQDGEWQIPGSDRTRFRLGERGTYTKGRDPDGVFIQIDADRKFYVEPSRPSDTTGGPPDPGPSIAGSETRVVIKGNQILVPVTLGYAGKEVQVSLLLDTGATITTLNRDSVRKLQPA